jgi:uncharacterized protein (TIGR02145 family)
MKRIFTLGVILVQGIGASAQTNKTISDKEGNVYKTVTIGTQTWMAENLKSTKFNDGTAITTLQDFSAWSNPMRKPAYCWYKNDQVNFGNTYGALYNWYVVDPSTNGNKNVCPVSWHVPTDDDWKALKSNLTDTIAGSQLKEAGTTHWLAPNTGASNSTGFTALPAGIRTDNGVFKEVGTTTSWWSATEFDMQTSWYRFLTTFSKGMGSSNYEGRKSGMSIRCIKD